MTELATINVGRAPIENSRRSVREQYDLSTGCPRCGTGSRMIAPLLMRRSDMKFKDIRETYLGHYVVDGAVAEGLLACGVPEACLPPIDLVTGGVSDGYREFRPRLVLPPMSPRSEGITTDQESRWLAQCSECRRDSFYGVLRVDPAYVYPSEAARPVSTDGCALTWEYFGRCVINPRKPPEVPFQERAGLARPRLIVSSLVGQFLATVRAVRVFPCRLEDAP